jgi:hypothetical protein
VRIAELQGDTSIENLAARVYQPAGAGIQAGVDALRAANPVLSDIQNLSAGTPVLVPELPQLGFSDATQPVAGVSVATVLDEFAANLPQLGRSLEDLAGQASTGAQQRLELIRSPDVQELLKQDPSTKDTIEALGVSAEFDLSVADAWKSGASVFLDSVMSDLQAMSQAQAQAGQA